MSETAKPATWRVVLAFILDVLTSFFVVGYIIGALTGNLSDGGFALQGGPAILAFALIIAYMWFMPRYGGRLWQRILRAR